MRSLINIAVLVLISCVAVASDEFESPVEFSSPKDIVYEVEPNGNAASANLLMVGDEMNAAINVGGDADWFSFAALAGEEVTFETHPGDAAHTVMFILDVDGRTRLAEDGTDGSGGYSLIEFVFPGYGTYFVVVAHYAFDGTGTYTLTAGPIDVVTECVVSGVLPSNPWSSGDTITILGTGFLEGAIPLIGDIEAAPFTRVSDTEITATVPELPDGRHVLVVSIPGQFDCEYGQLVVDAEAHTWGTLKSMYR